MAILRRVSRLPNSYDKYLLSRKYANNKVKVKVHLSGCAMLLRIWYRLAQLNILNNRFTSWKATSILEEACVVLSMHYIFPGVCIDLSLVIFSICCFRQDSCMFCHIFQWFLCNRSSCFLIYVYIYFLSVPSQWQYLGIT